MEHLYGAIEKLHEVEGWKKPTSLKLDKWETLNSLYVWRKTHQECFYGVNWTYVNHSSQDGENECFGMAKFSYEDRHVILYMMKLS